MVLPLRVIRIPLGLSSNGAPIDFSDASLSSPIAVGYIARDQWIDQMDYVPAVVAGDDDLVLEAGEIFSITLDLTVDCSKCQVAAGETFTVELMPDDGSSYLVIERTLPAQLGAGTIIVD